MNASFYFPKNNIYIESDDKYKEIFTTLTHDKKLYLVNAYCYNKRVYLAIQLILRLKNIVLDIQNCYQHLRKLMMVDMNIKCQKKYVIK